MKEWGKWVERKKSMERKEEELIKKSKNDNATAAACRRPLDGNIVYGPSAGASTSASGTPTLPPKPRLSDGYSQIFRLYGHNPSGFWTMALLRYAAKFDPFLSLVCATTPSTLAQSKERKGSNFAIWKPCPKPSGIPGSPCPSINGTTAGSTAALSDIDIGQFDDEEDEDDEEDTEELLNTVINSGRPRR